MDSELLTSSTIKIAPEGWALTLSSVQQALLRVLERLAALEEEVSRLRAENERLREQTRRSSRNSSQPPSSDAWGALPRQQRQSGGRKRGAQPGHEGHQRKLYPVEACRSVNNHRPAACSACGTALFGEIRTPCGIR
jgi:transposase